MSGRAIYLSKAANMVSVMSVNIVVPSPSICPTPTDSTISCSAGDWYSSSMEACPFWLGSGYPLPGVCFGLAPSHSISCHTHTYSWRGNHYWGGSRYLLTCYSHIINGSPTMPGFKQGTIVIRTSIVKQLILIYTPLVIFNTTGG